MQVARGPATFSNCSYREFESVGVALASEDPPQSITRRARMNGELGRRLYLAAVVAAGGSVLVWSAVETIARPPGTLWLVLAALTAISSAAAVRLPGFPVS